VGELPPSSTDDRPKRLGAVVNGRLDPELAEALSREAERRSRVSGTTIGHTTLARQLIAEGLRPPAQRVTVEGHEAAAVDGLAGGCQRSGTAAARHARDRSIALTARYTADKRAGQTVNVGPVGVEPTTNRL